MFRKKSPILTATICNLMENLRLAVEVMTGKPVRFVHADFNTGNIRIRVGQEEKEIHYVPSRDDLIHFCLGELKTHEPWVVARFDKPEEVRVIPEGIRGGLPSCFKKINTWWVGTSFANRWEEPLYPNTSAS